MCGKNSSVGNTLIATPAGGVRVTDVTPGMLVWSVSADGRTTVVLSLDSNVENPQLAAEYGLVDHVMCSK